MAPLGAPPSFNRSVATVGATPVFQYRLVWANHKDAGRAAYQADIGPGDVILSYHGQWLRVLSRTPIYDQASPYDALLQVEPTY
jgi:hypothetical protein